MPTKLDADATYSVVGLNYNDQEPGDINKDTNVTDDQEPGEIITNSNVTDADTDFNDYAIFKKSMLFLEPNIISQH